MRASSPTQRSSYRQSQTCPVGLYPHKLYKPQEPNTLHWLSSACHPTHKAFSWFLVGTHAYTLRRCLESLANSSHPKLHAYKHSEPLNALYSLCPTLHRWTSETGKRKKKHTTREQSTSEGSKMNHL